MQDNWVIISVGGSLIVPDEIDTEFLKALKQCIETHVAAGMRFVLISGGGKTARRYQSAADTLLPLSRDDLDWLGIHSTRLNGHLLRTMFKDQAHPVVIRDFKDVASATSSIIIAAGWKPGHNTDYDAVGIANVLGAKKIINLSDITHVYDSDPDENPDAKPFDEIGWNDFRNLLPAEWSPGLSSPFDPIAARDAQKAGIEVAMISGSDLSQLDAYITDQPFVGTRIF